MGVLRPHSRSMVRIAKQTRQLRHAQTDAEKLLWKHLRKKQENGHRFRRQHPVDSYIADFACIKAGLIVEVDGGQHADQHARYLETRGFRVLRFWNNEVLQNIEGVMYQIRVALKEPANPHPSLPPRMGMEGGFGSSDR